MQNRYVGDFGDFVKFSLLRALSQNKKLGVNWYLYPDEDHNNDGKHTAYLNDPEKWRHLDPELFDTLRKIVQVDRSVFAIQKSKILKADFCSDFTDVSHLKPQERHAGREAWFNATTLRLETSDLIFADPDNGIIDDKPERRKSKVFGKQMPLSEVQRISAGRTAIIYHHNTRFTGGHDAEVNHWLGHFGYPAFAVRSNSYSCRTFFILNPDADILKKASDFCYRWSDYKVKLHT